MITSDHMMKPKKLLPLADPARRIDVHFSIKYVECDLADKRFECKPQLQVYLSSHFVREPESGGVVDIKLIEDDRQHSFVGSLVGSLKREHEGISDTACIGLSTYALHRNDSGVPCYVNVGTSHVRIADVLREIKERGFYDHNHDLIMRTVVMSGLEPIKKGVVEVRIEKVELGHALLNKPLVQSALSVGSDTAISSSLTSYIEATMNFESAIKDTFPNTERVRAPMDISEVGIELTPGTFLPVAAYAMTEPPRSNAEYWQNALERVMERRGLKPAEYHDLTLHDKAGLMGDMICFNVQSYDYIGDAVERGNRLNKKIAEARVGIEEFAVVGPSITYAGDCEDVAGTICARLEAFQAVAIDASKYPRVAEMQAIARRYVSGTSLSVVAGQKIGDELQFGAHMFCSLIPENTITTMLSRSAEGRKILARMQAPTVVPSVFPVGTNAAAQDEDLPTLIGEGTGHLASLYYVDEMLPHRRTVGTQMPAFEPLKKWIPREKPGDTSTFYYGPLELYTSHFIRNHGINIGSFVFGQVNDDSSLSRGILFTDLVTNSPRIAIIPHPVIPAPVMSIIREAISLRPPPRPLILDRTKPMLGTERDPLLDRFVADVKGLKRTPPIKVPRGGSVDLFIRPHQYDDVKIHEMFNDVRRVDNVYDASYELELGTNQFYNYRLRLFVK